MIQVRGGRKKPTNARRKVCLRIRMSWKKRNFNLTGNNFTDYSTPPEKLYITMCENFETFNSCFEKENVWKYFRNLINVHEETFESDKRVNIWCHWPALDGWMSPSWLWSCKSHVYFYFSTSFVLKLNELMFFCWISQKVFKLICACKFFNCGFWKCWTLTSWAILAIQVWENLEPHQDETDSLKIFLWNTK